MNHALGFDNAHYLQEQKRAILDRMGRFSNKLYLEFGGKLFFDYHAARVLPGYDPNVKMKLLQELRSQADFLLCIYAGDIERRKMRADFGHTYDVDALKLIDDLGEWGIGIKAVVITRFDNQPAARIFKNKLERQGIRVYTHSFTKGYPTDVDVIVSDEGYGANDYIGTEHPLVIVTGPGPGSGKLATCLSQLYHEHRRGLSSGYAKFETFPIWNIPLKHPINVAYEAATADIGDFNLVDPFHLEAYGKPAVNYNRDVEVFPVLRRIIEKITGAPSFYKSPTDMGCNAAGFGIADDAVCQEAAKQELVRRFFRYSCEYSLGFVEPKRTAPASSGSGPGASCGRLRRGTCPGPSRPSTWPSRIASTSKPSANASTAGGRAAARISCPTRAAGALTRSSAAAGPSPSPARTTSSRAASWRFASTPAAGSGRAGSP